MLYSQKASIIKRASEKMFLNFDQTEIDFFSVLEWDDLMNHFEIRYGTKLQQIFEDMLIETLKERKEKEAVKQWPSFYLNQWKK